MEEKEEKGFVVKDRRKISLDDAEQEPETEHIQEQKKQSNRRRVNMIRAEASQKGS